MSDNTIKFTNPTAVSERIGEHVSEVLHGPLDVISIDLINLGDRVTRLENRPVDIDDIIRRVNDEVDWRDIVLNAIDESDVAERVVDYIDWGYEIENHLDTDTIVEAVQESIDLSDDIDDRIDRQMDRIVERVLDDSSLICRSGDAIKDGVRDVISNDYNVREDIMGLARQAVKDRLGEEIEKLTENIIANEIARHAARPEFVDQVAQNLASLIANQAVCACACLDDESSVLSKKLAGLDAKIERGFKAAEDRAIVAQMLANGTEWRLNQMCKAGSATPPADILMIGIADANETVSS